MASSSQAQKATFRYATSRALSDLRWGGSLADYLRIAGNPGVIASNSQASIEKRPLPITPDSLGSGEHAAPWAELSAPVPVAYRGDNVTGDAAGDAAGRIGIFPPDRPELIRDAADSG